MEGSFNFNQSVSAHTTSVSLIVSKTKKWLLSLDGAQRLEVAEDQRRNQTAQVRPRFCLIILIVEVNGHVKVEVGVVVALRKNLGIRVHSTPACYNLCLWECVLYGKFLKSI